MKKENTVTVLVAFLLAYPVYNWSVAIFRILNGDGNISFGFSSWFYIATLLTGIVALVRYYVSNYKRSQLLRAYVIFTLMGSVVGLITNLVELRMPGNISDLMRRIVIEVVYIVALSYSLHSLTATRIPVVGTDGSVIAVDKGIRFLNRLLDFLLFACIVFSSYQWWEQLFPDLFRFEIFNNFRLQIAELIFFFIYYLAMEHFFHTSLGKTITNTTVVNVNGSYASPSTIVIRTLCRFIPLDAFSFLFGKGWHDQISNTIVVKETYSEIKTE